MIKQVMGIKQSSRLGCLFIEWVGVEVEVTVNPFNRLKVI